MRIQNSWYWTLFVFIFGCGGTVSFKKASKTDLPPEAPYSKRVAVTTLKFPNDIPNSTNLGAGFPTKLSQTGVFADVKTLKLNPGIIEYTVQVPLWSDGAIKRRFIALPGTSTINFQASDNWQFPIGTVLIKHFEMPLTPTKIRRMETRILVYFQSRWAGFDYKWNSDESDADLIDTRVEENLTIQAGTIEKLQKYIYPGRTQCLDCHNAYTGSVLGVHTRQLNHDLELIT